MGIIKFKKTFKNHNKNGKLPNLNTQYKFVINPYFIYNSHKSDQEQAKEQRTHM